MVHIHNYYKLILAIKEILNEVDVVIVSDNAITCQVDNTQKLHKLDEPHHFTMYDLLRAHMGGGAKYTVTNNLHLLKDVKWYNYWF